MAKKFKPGDKVVLDGVPAYLRGVKDGDEGRVVAIDPDPVQPYVVNINGTRWAFAAKELRRLDIWPSAQHNS